MRYSYSITTDDGKEHTGNVEQSFAEFGESLSGLIGEALDHAFTALDEVDWQAEMEIAMSELSDEDLREMEREIEEAQRELEEAKREMVEAHVLKDEVRREVEEAMRDAERALRETRREREARCRRMGTCS